MEEPPAFSVTAVPHGQSTRLIVAGELDMATERELRDAIERAREDGRGVVIDLGATTFVDSSGIKLLLRAIDTAKVDGWDLAMAERLQPPVRRAFALAGVLPLLPIVEDADRTDQ